MRDGADWIAGRVPLIVHTGAMTTAEVMELTRHAKSSGASAASVLPPYFYSYSDDSLLRHFVSVAEAVADFPVFLYSIPSNTKNDISPDLLSRILSAAPNVAGIKSSNPDLVRLQQYMSVGGMDFRSSVVLTA